MMMARAKWAAECGTTERMLSPSRTCKCQSSGVVMVIDVCAAAAAGTAAAAALTAAAEPGRGAAEDAVVLLLKVLGKLSNAAADRWPPGHSCVCRDGGS